MTDLVKYEAARHALQAALSVDEVKDIRDKAQAMAMYARQAKDTEMIEWATEIKVRAERRAGQMIAEAGIKAGNPQLSKATTIANTLENIGISRDQSSKWQKLGAVPEAKFEAAIVAAKESPKEFTSTAIARMTAAPKVSTKPKVKPKIADIDPENPDYVESVDLLKEFEAAAKEIDKLTALVESLKKSDLAKELAAQQLKYDQLEGRLNQEINTCNAAKDQIKYQTILLNEIRKTLVVQQNKFIVPRIMVLLGAHVVA